MAGATPATSGISGFDLAIIITYMAGILAIGTYFGRYVKSATDFFLAGRALPFWAIGMSIVVSDIGATDFIFVGGAAYSYGIAAANFDWMGSMPAMAIAAFVFMPYYWRSSVYTIPEFLGKRYNAGVQIIHAAIWGVFMVVMLAVIFWTTANFLNTTVGWPIPLSIAITVIVVGIYTLSGGLAAVVMTDVIQMIVMFVGGIALLVLSLWEVGGWSSLQAQIGEMAKADPKYADHFTIMLPNDTTTPYPWAGIVLGLGLIMSTAYFSGHQGIVQRCFGARTEWDAKAGMLFGGFLKSFIPFMVAIPGLAAVIIVPGLATGDNAVPEMINQLLPAGIRGLTFSALVASFMSSADTYLSSASTIWTTDLYGRLYQYRKGKAPSERHGLIVGRIFTVVFIIFAVLMAYPIGQTPSMYTFIQKSLSMFQGPVFAILLLGIMWKRATQWGGLAGLVLGVASSTILHNTQGLFTISDPFLFVAMWSFVFTVIVTVVVSLCTRPEPEEKLRGLIFGQVIKDGKVQRVLLDRVS
ncbi:MAG TPA: sodium/solute symporter [Candidatus Hydrogenedentes bacterium]|nr:sodium/solute symporter [Candidatus Hydrogenedentota bacterium]HRK35251.1 sodium/solute symporter [Candidatus Hydrogenedentota bacterium]